MDIKDLEKEKEYLKTVLTEIDLQKQSNNDQLQIIIKERQDFSKHFSDDFYYMDDEEALAEGDMLSEFDQAEDFIKKQISRLNRQEYSPFFGRVDFLCDGVKNSYYIGVNNLTKLGEDIPLICDWRAPVSCLFYDYELGEAEYNAPNGNKKGEVVLKRQFEIKNKEMIKAFDSAVTIGDEILKDVLSKKSTKKMKTIISSIQKEQNKIIRNKDAKTLLVQGVAGSGKTSIALHRVAYLLYQNKENLKAEDILILSPNTMFSSYIADVLPELGEENISQMSFFKLAKDELAFIKKGIQTREENLSVITKSASLLNEVAYKNTYDFYEALEKYCDTYFNVAFEPTDLKFGNVIIKAEELRKLYYQTYKTKTPAVKLEWIVDYIIDRLNVNKNVNEVAARIKKLLYPFFKEYNIINIYADFLANIGMQFSFYKEKIRYDDLAPLLYIANYFFGLSKRKEVKYLIIDEMQDYSFVHYVIFKSIFDCNKTILGDINQCIEKIMTKKDLNTLTEMLNAEYIELNKSYRSTYEIMTFANNIKQIECEKVERFGGEPVLIDASLNDVDKIVNEIANSESFNSIAILTKNQEEAKTIYMHLNTIEDASLILSTDEELAKVSIMPSYIAKGLEFDAVIIPYYNSKNYSSYLDKNLLYVSSTRAMHKLYLLNIID